MTAADTFRSSIIVKSTVCFSARAKNRISTCTYPAWSGGVVRLHFSVRMLFASVGVGTIT
jgi:hypothetical protein